MASGGGATELYVRVFKKWSVQGEKQNLHKPLVLFPASTKTT
jgi:hypothetical protein